MNWTSARKWWGLRKQKKEKRECTEMHSGTCCNPKVSPLSLVILLWARLQHEYKWLATLGSPNKGVCSDWVNLHLKSKQGQISILHSQYFVQFCLADAVEDWRLTEKSIPSARTDRLRKINLVTPVRVYFKTSSFAKYIERAPSS